MLKNKGARVIGKHPFQHRFWCPDGKSNEFIYLFIYLFILFMNVFISRFSTALSLYKPVLLLFLSYHINYNNFYFFLQNVYQCLISIRII